MEDQTAYIPMRWFQRDGSSRTPTEQGWKVELMNFETREPVGQFALQQSADLV